MKICLKHKRLRCESVNGVTFLANDYEIVSMASSEVFGICELRHASIDVLPYTGNVTYTVFERYRGRGFAKQALVELSGIASEDGMRELWITCDANNSASIGVCRSVGAVFVDELDVSSLQEYRSRGIDKIKRFKLFI